MDVNSLRASGEPSLVNQGTSGKVIKDGSQVLVRIISDKGNGHYEASVAGVRTTLVSKSPLKAGSTFTGIANTGNGIIKITPNQNNSSEVFKVMGMEVMVNGDGSLFSIIENTHLSMLMQSFGMVPNNLSLVIFQQMKQLEMKMDAEVLNKIYNLAIKFKGKEKKAAEIIVMLKQKSVELTEENILMALQEMELLEGDGNNRKKNGEPSPRNTKSTDFPLNMISASQIENFIKGIAEFRDENIGIFTIMNHLGWKKDKSGSGSWIVLPYEIRQDENLEKGTTGTVLGNGDLRFYLDQARNLKRILVKCFVTGKTNLFAIKIERDKYEIKVYSDGVTNKEKYIEALKRFLKVEKILGIEFVEKNSLEGFASGTEEVVILGGKA